MIHLSDPDHPNYHALNDLFDYIPGMILDSAIGILIENMLSNKVDKSESLGIVLSEFELVSWDSYGGLSANSIFPIIEDPVGHLLSCFTNSQGLDVVSILNVAEALFGLIPSSGIQSFNQLSELIDSNAVSSVSKIVIPVSIFEIVLWKILILSVLLLSVYNQIQNYLLH